MTAADFYNLAVPKNIREREASKNIFLVWNRAIAWREAYVLNKFGITGNMVSLFRVLLGLISLYLFSSLRFGQIDKPIFGVMLMAWQINLDAVDGSLARVQGKSSAFGNNLDNLGIDYVRSGFFILIAFMSGNMYLGITSLLASYLLVTFRQYLGVDLHIRLDKIASLIIYVPILLVLLPLFIISLVYLGLNPLLICKAVSLFYIAFAAIWFVACIIKNVDEKKS